jgi:hypothetical protein
MGETPVIFIKDEVEGLMRTDGTPLEAAAPNTRTVQLGDAERNPDTQAPAAPPSLRNPGEKLPGDNDPTKAGVMKPVQFPTKKPEPQPGANPDGEPDASPPANVQPAPPDASQSGPAKPQPPPTPGSSQPN